MKYFRWTCPVCLILLFPFFVRADLVPIRVYVHFSSPCWNAIDTENRLHDKNLLSFQSERRDAQTKCRQQLFECRLDSNPKPCIDDATAEENRTMTDISKREASENNRHMKRMDEIGKNCSSWK